MTAILDPLTEETKDLSTGAVVISLEEHRRRILIVGELPEPIVEGIKAAEPQSDPGDEA